jgi:hypothetical protein
VNQKLIAAIVKAYDLDRAKVVFKDRRGNFHSYMSALDPEKVGATFYRKGDW